MPRLAAHPTLPSVTEIIAGVGLAWDYKGIDEKYSLLGKAAHETVHLRALGELDLASVHPDVAPALRGYEQWALDVGHVPLASEQELVHTGYGYVGHLDRVGSVHAYTRALVDWKYTDSPDLKAARIQLAGYRIAWDFVHPEAPIERCFVVQLRKDGRAVPHDLTDDYARQVFLAALIVFTERHR